METVPIKLWGLDPLYRTHIKLFVKDVLQLDNYPNFTGIYMLVNHPIQHVQVLGYVVKVDRKEKNIIYGVDDGTATISCCHWIDNEISDNDREQIDLGNLITVSGKITIFRGQRQITVTIIRIEQNPNAEVLFWLDVMKKKQLYNKPFTMPEKLKTEQNVVTKPWLTDPYSIEVDKLEEALKCEILKFLDVNNAQSFRTTDLYGNNNVKQKATEVFQKYMEKPQVSSEEGKQVDVQLTRQQFHEVVNPQLRVLEKQGLMYKKAGLGHFFETITKDSLQPDILEIMKKTNNQGDNEHGIATNEIFKELRMLVRYKHLKKQSLEDVLGNLVEDGDIYEVDNYHYKLLGI